MLELWELAEPLLQRLGPVAGLPTLAQFYALMVNVIVNVFACLFPLSWATNDPLWPAASPETPEAVPLKVAVNLPFAFVRPEPV